MHILIASHIDYYTKTLPPLIASLVAAGVPSGSYTSIVAGKDTDYNAYEYTPLIWLAEQKQFNNDNYVFLLHDTCIVQPHFWTSIKDIKELKRLSAMDSMNIGVYPVGMLRLIREQLALFKNCNKTTAIAFEDFIFNTHQNFNYFDRRKIYGGIENPYGSETIRHKEIYSNIGLIKYRANNGSQMVNTSIL